MGTEENNIQDNNQAEQQVNTQPATKNGFAFLRELCSFNADFNAREPRPTKIKNK